MARRPPAGLPGVIVVLIITHVDFYLGAVAPAPPVALLLPVGAVSPETLCVPAAGPLWGGVARLSREPVRPYPLCEGCAPVAGSTSVWGGGMI